MTMNKAVLIVGLLVLNIGCGGGENTIVSEDTQTAEPDILMADVAAELSLEDQASAPELILDFWQTEFGHPDTAPQCAPGEGCFLDQCQENVDCLSGWCVEHMGVGVCTASCQEDCPPGWGCKPVGSGGPDIVYVCVSDYANLCKPCVQGSDCKNVGGADDVCLDYGDEGNFCGGTCDDDQECPWGFTCKEALTVDGVGLSQCVADAGVCPCTDKSVELGLWTPCALENELGICEGMRVCTADGLSDCDAPEPAAEVCNAIDDNCNGLVDEVDQDEGTPVCDDNNPCSLDVCNGDGGCAHEALSEGECLDGDACTIGDHCEEGNCVGLPITCDDGDLCTADFCDGLGGCTTEFNTATCDDGDPCTVNDTCSDGQCGGYAVDCDCSVDADCLGLEDGDLCNGTLVCDTAKLPYLCQVAQDTVVECPAPEEGPDAICLKSVCAAESGACSLVPDHEGFSCNDGDLCTIGDQCVEGVCTPGVAPNCNDGNLCTDDSCDPDAGCVHSDNIAPCEDGELCTIGDTCADGACLSGGPLACDDGDLCNGEESCVPGKGCTPGIPLSCNDGDPCNGNETCDPTVGCQAGDALQCDDGDVCNGEEACVPGVGCLPGVPLVCQEDGDVCTDMHCDPEAGCVTVLNSAPCDDEDVCTWGDHCHLGQCISSGTLTCDDNNGCTDDSCDPKSGCVFLNNTAQCDDGNECTTVDACENGVCVPSVASDVLCDDDNICTDDICNPDLGCIHTNNTTVCDDGDACTASDNCKDAKCVPGQPLVCNDDLFCNGVETCDFLVGCQPGEPPVLVDGVDCTMDVCDEDIDQVLHTPMDGWCDDKLFCNGLETCDFTDDCQPGAPPETDDEVECTEDTCDEDADQVLHTPMDGWCIDDLFCNGVETCDQFNDCQPGLPPELGDGVGCTEDTCDEDVDQVVHTPMDELCLDDLFCNGVESCDPFNDCQPGDPPPVNDDDPCTQDSCDEATDQILHTPVLPMQLNFGTCGSTGHAGPSQGNCDSAYGATTLAGKVTVSGGVQIWTAPQSGTYDIEAVGAGGGRGKQHNTNFYSNGVPGKGAGMAGRFALQQGDVLHIVVGQKGLEALSSKQKGGGGGGGSYVVRANGTPLLVAGGGGGSGRYDGDNGDDAVTGQNGTSGNGANGASGGTGGQGGNVPGCGYAGNSGAGISGNGKSVCSNSYYAKSFTNGAQGSDWSHCWSDGNAGGFGGGGGTGPHGGGGGGGYSGGGGGGDINCGGNGGGGGGGSYNAGDNQDNQAGHEAGNGSVTVSVECE